MMQLLELFFVFFHIGVMTFGGGYAMISLIQQEVVARGYCTTAEFANMVALSQMTPGAVALNAATYLGKTVAGFPGAIVANLGLVVPAFIITSAVLWLAERISGRYIKRATQGIRAGAVGLIGSAFFFFAETSLLNKKIVSGTLLNGSLQLQWEGFNWIGVVVFVAALFLAWRVRLASHWIILFSLCAGGVGYLCISFLS